MLLAVPTTKSATGKVDKPSLGANDWPIIPPKKIIKTLSDMNSARPTESSQTFLGKRRIYFLLGFCQLFIVTCLDRLSVS